MVGKIAKNSTRAKEALLYKKLQDKKVRCNNCAHYCVISSGERGICGVRENKGGSLYSLVYGKAVACHIDPIEKKPFFHFLPGTYSLSVAAVGCNLACPWCQNYDISQEPKPNQEIIGEDLQPEEIVNLAKKNKLPSISYTYTEPTIFLEYALDTMKLAKKEGIKNTWVTNGFLSKEAFEAVAPYLDAANVDLKGWTDDFYKKHCKARLQPILDTLIRMKNPKGSRRDGTYEAGKKIWVEVTTLIVPTFNDNENWFREIANFIKKELGPETPWHVTKFSGLISWQTKDLRDTPIETIEKAYKIGKEAGLKYVYTGNIPNIPSEDTFCSKCGALSIDRTNYAIHRYDKAGKCPKCGKSLDLILS